MIQLRGADEGSTIFYTVCFDSFAFLYHHLTDVALIVRGMQTWVAGE
jgi:hypothetical protein